MFAFVPHLFGMKIQLLMVSVLSAFALSGCASESVPSIEYETSTDADGLQTVTAASPAKAKEVAKQAAEDEIGQVEGGGGYGGFSVVCATDEFERIANVVWLTESADGKAQAATGLEPGAIRFVPLEGVECSEDEVDNSGPIDASSGRPLSEFKDSPSYPYREALSRNQEAYLAEMAAIRPGWGKHRNLVRALDTCSDADREVADPLGNVKLRFEGGTTPDVTDAEAQQILSLVDKFVCSA